MTLQGFNPLIEQVNEVIKGLSDRYDLGKSVIARRTMRAINKLKRVIEDLELLKNKVNKHYGKRITKNKVEAFEDTLRHFFRQALSPARQEEGAELVKKVMFYLNDMFGIAISEPETS